MNDKRKALINLYIHKALKNAIAEACEFTDYELVTLLKERVSELADGVLNEDAAIEAAAKKIPDYLSEDWK